ncbi:MAG: hypothetical protein ACLR9M_03660 [Eggerthella lenta]
MDHAVDLDVNLAPIAHVVRASAGFEALVERLLGADVSALLVDDAARANAVAAALAARDEQGEVVLVPRAGEARRACPAREAAAAGLGRALVDELAYADEDAAAVEALLGDVAVCDDVDAAFAAHARGAEGVRFVTRGGCVVWPNGKVTLGAAAVDDEEGVLARARRLEELRAQLRAAESERASAEERAAAAEEALRAAQGESLRLSQELAELRGKTDSARAEARRAEEKLAAVRREFEDIERQRGEAERTVAQARPSVEALEQKLAALKQELSRQPRATRKRRRRWCRFARRPRACATRCPKPSSRPPRFPSGRRTRAAWWTRARAIWRPWRRATPRRARAS